MINELPKIANIISVLYADDSNFICSNKNPVALCSQFNNKLIKFGSDDLIESEELTSFE